MELLRRSSASRACLRLLAAGTAHRTVYHHLTTPSINAATSRSYASVKGAAAKGARNPKRKPSAPSEHPLTSGTERKATLRKIEQNLRHIPEALRDAPEDYLRCVQEYIIMTSHGVMPLHQKGLQERGLSLGFIYQTACIVRHLDPDLGMNMCLSAAELDHRPSLLMLMLFLLASPKLRTNVKVRLAEARFQQLVAQRDDSDVLTIEGVTLVKEGHHKHGIKVLQQALDMNTADFEYKEDCLASLAEAYVTLGRVDDARALLEPQELSKTGRGEAVLGKALANIDPDAAVRYLYHAACLGRPNLFNHLCEIEMGKAETATDKNTAKDHRRLAAEWSMLASPQTNA